MVVYCESFSFRLLMLLLWSAMAVSETWRVSLSAPPGLFSWARSIVKFSMALVCNRQILFGFGHVLFLQRLFRFLDSQLSLGQGLVQLRLGGIELFPERETSSSCSLLLASLADASSA